ncbi:MAG: Zn-binding domain-containing protein [Candidatus Neomarinimicrobiota bacterium]
MNKRRFSKEFKSKVAVEALKGIQTIIFALSRLNVEVLTKYLKDDFESGRSAMSQPEKIAGYPGSISSTWQQFGRAGRRGKSAIGIFVARSTPIDQYLMQHPEYFFSKSPEHARINPDNLMILVDHIKCAAFELPFEDRSRFGNVEWKDLKEILKFLQDGGILHQSGNRWYWSEDVYPAIAVNLRRIPEGNFVVVDTDNHHKVIAEVDYSSAAMTIYPDAIYMTDGAQHVVDQLDWDGRKAYVRKTDSDYYTDSIDYTNVKVLVEDEKRSSGGLSVFQGEVQVVTRVVGYKKIKFYTLENVGYGKINLPDLEMATTAYWFTIPQALLDAMNYSRADVVDGILGVSKALHSLATLKIISEPYDIHRSVGDKSSEWFAMNTITERGIYTPATNSEPSIKLDPDDLSHFQPTIFIYDNYPGGIGFSSRLFDSHEELLTGALELIMNCPCKDGCPSCVGPSKEVGEKSKEIAIDILKHLTGKKG